VPSQQLRRALDGLRGGDLGANVVAWCPLAPERPVYGDMPRSLDGRLVRLLAERGIDRLYSHQSEAVGQALAGEDVAVVTPTASGKTLCYNLPVLQSLLQDPEARSLYLFPTKALAHDQLDELSVWLDGLGIGTVAGAYDGDTPSGQRARIRTTARVLVTNPDMLHTGILPSHARWHDFFGGLAYVVIDEMHQYRGVFGSHVANVLRRLERVCAFHGSRPQYLLCSATIANPDDLALRLTGGHVHLVTRSGAPRGRRNLILYNPPIQNLVLGLRRAMRHDARLIATRFLRADVQTVVFAISRLTVELLVSQLRVVAERMGLDPAVIRGYRGGYLPSERRDIERGLRDGSVRMVVATNALELGVDIGGMEACIMVGYPGTLASTWQQAGRAGRGEAESAAVLVASDSPLNQYVVNHPDYLLGRSPEHALINPDNLYVLLSHVRCAAYELPFEEGESFGGQDLGAILEFMADEGVVRATRGRWHWSSEDYPAASVSLRTADPTQVAIVAQEEDGRRRTIGLVDRESAARMVHEGAIYIHEGRQYLVESLNWERALAQVKPASVDYYTAATSSTRLTIEQELETSTEGALVLTLGEVTLTTRVTGYRRIQMGSGQVLGWGEIDLPEQQMLTYACWMCLAEEQIESLREESMWTGEVVESRGSSWAEQRDRARARDGYRCRWCGAPERPGQQHHVHHVVPFREAGWVAGENENDRRANRLENLITLCPSCHRKVERNVAVQSTLSSLGRVLGNLVPLYAMCAHDDIGVLTELLSAQTGAPTLYVYDNVPYGVGISEEVMELFPELLERAAEVVRDCPCAGGCPSCIGPGAARVPYAKTQVLGLIDVLLGDG